MRYPPVVVPTRAAQWVAALLVGVSAVLAIKGFSLSWITVLAGLGLSAAFLLPGARLNYTTENRALTVQTVFSRRTFPLRGARASVVRLDGEPGNVVRKQGWSGLSGHLGRFEVGGLGPVDLYTSTLRGKMVLISLPGRLPIVLSPQDPDALARDVNGE